METTKINTGIEGLDSLLDGGLIKNRTILIQGKACTGKSTVHSKLYNHVLICTFYST